MFLMPGSRLQGNARQALLGLNRKKALVIATAADITAATTFDKIVTPKFLRDAGIKLDNPAFTGAPTAPTQTLGDNSTKIATTAYSDANGWKLVTTLTPSGVATQDYTFPADANYEYEFVLINIVPATTAVTLRLQVDIGSGFATTGYLGSDANGALAISAITNAAGKGFSAFFRFMGDITTSKITPVVGSGGSYSGPSSFTAVNIANMYNTAGAIGAVRFMFSSGNIASGTIIVNRRKTA